MPKRTYQPSALKRARKFGFRARLFNSLKGGRFNVLRRRRAKGRVRLSTV